MTDVRVTLSFRFTSDHSVNHLTPEVLRAMLGQLAAGGWGTLEGQPRIENHPLTTDDLDTTRALLAGKGQSDLIRVYEPPNAVATPLPAPTPTAGVSDTPVSEMAGKVRDALDAEKATEAENPDGIRPAREFIETCCHLGGAEASGWKHLHQAYKNWCAANNQPILPVNEWRALLIDIHGITIAIDGSTVEGITIVSTG
jgi:hypothetical protein